jgi:hypothetical protein
VAVGARTVGLAAFVTVTCNFEVEVIVGATAEAAGPQALSNIRMIAEKIRPSNWNLLVFTDFIVRFVIAISIRGRGTIP